MHSAVLAAILFFAQLIMSTPWKALLALSLAGNVVLGILHFGGAPESPQERHEPRTAEENPRIMIDPGSFDFSGTGLSDKSWKVDPPDLAEPEKSTAEPLVPEKVDFDSITIFPPPPAK